MKNKLIILLIGQKGSGKSLIGSLLGSEFQIKFIRVEDWAKEVKRNRSIDNETYLEEVFKAIGNGVKRESANYDSLCFESTGLTVQFERMLENLGKEFNVFTVKIVCDPKVCIERVKSRNSDIHINVSDDEVKRINSEVLKRNYRTDFELENSAKSKDELTKELNMILKKISTNIFGNNK